MLSAGVENEEKKPFEIFTQYEVNQITRLQYNPEITKLLMQLTQVLNNGMHNPAVSWHNKICSLSLEKKEPSAAEQVRHPN